MITFKNVTYAQMLISHLHIIRKPNELAQATNEPS
jgi:hypothetical protein